MNCKYKLQCKTKNCTQEPKWFIMAKRYEKESKERKEKIKKILDYANKLNW